jgi:hypothetical protein
MTLSFDHVRPAPGLTQPPCPVVKVAASMEIRACRPDRSMVRGQAAATNERELFADRDNHTRRIG